MKTQDCGTITWQQGIAFAKKRAAGARDPAGGDTSMDTDREDFFQTRTLAAAIGLMENGWHAGVASVVATLDMLPASDEVLPDWSLEACGSFPCVPAYLSGEPECIWRMQDDRKAERRLTMVIPAFFSCRCAGPDVLRYAAAVAAVTRAVEASGISVAVIATGATYSRKTEIAYLRSTVVREHGEPFDLSKIAFSAHPSFNRRIEWAWREQTPDVAYAIGHDNYGTSKTEAWTHEVLDKHIGDRGTVCIVKHIDDMAGHGADLTTDEMIAIIRADVTAAIAKAA